MEVPGSCGRRARETDCVILGGVEIGLSSRKFGGVLVDLLGRPVSMATVSRVAKKRVGTGSGLIHANTRWRHRGEHRLAPYVRLATHNRGRMSALRLLRHQVHARSRGYEDDSQDTPTVLLRLFYNEVAVAVKRGHGRKRTNRTTAPQDAPRCAGERLSLNLVTDLSSPTLLSLSDCRATLVARFRYAPPVIQSGRKTIDTQTFKQGHSVGVDHLYIKN